MLYIDKGFFKTYHGMLYIEVNPGLLWVDTDLDGIVHCTAYSNLRGLNLRLYGKRVQTVLQGQEC